MRASIATEKALLCITVVVSKNQTEKTKIHIVNLFAFKLDCFHVFVKSCVCFAHTFECKEKEEEKEMYNTKYSICLFGVAVAAVAAVAATAAADCASKRMHM